MAIPDGMRRLTVDLAEGLREDLEEASVGDGVSAPARLRALATIWREDASLQARVTALAHQQRVAARKRAARSRQATLAARASGVAHKAG